MSLDKSFTSYIDQFLPYLKDLKLHHYKDDDTITFYLHDKKRKTHFVFFYFTNFGYGKDLNCSYKLYNELQSFFSTETDKLLLDWFFKTYEIAFDRLVPTPLVSRL